MQRIEIERQKKLLKRAKKTLNCILLAKSRINHNQDAMIAWKSYFFYSYASLVDRKDTLQRCIVRLEQRYAKIISQL